MFRASLLIFGHQMVSSFGLFLTGENLSTADYNGGGKAAFAGFMGGSTTTSGAAAGPVFRQKITIECKDKNKKDAKCPVQPSLLSDSATGETTRKTCYNAGKDRVFGTDCETDSDTDLVIYETMTCVSCDDGNSVACPDQLSSKPIGQAQSSIPTQNTYYFDNNQKVVRAPADNTTNKC